MKQRKGVGEEKPLITGTQVSCSRATGGAGRVWVEVSPALCSLAICCRLLNIKRWREAAGELRPPPGRDCLYAAWNSWMEITQPGQVRVQKNENENKNTALTRAPGRHLLIIYGYRAEEILYTHTRWTMCKRGFTCLSYPSHFLQ